MENLLVPSAIQRIRSFLIEMCGMKVKPWATAEETLAALHTTLVARHGCDIFWTSLRGLLETLARDLKTRQAASPGALVDNEVLDSERYATLLDEIRAALARQTAEPATFRRLASALSAPALGLLLFLGGAVSVGCDNAGLHGPPTQDASPLQPVDAMAAPPEANRDASVSLPDALPVPAPVDSRMALPLSRPDGPIIIIPASPDARPATDAVAPKSSDGATVTIQDIMHACNMSDLEQGAVLKCLATVGAAWNTELPAVFAGVDCSSVAQQLNCFVQSQFCGSYMYNAAWSGPDSTLVCRPIIIYAGVRFV